MTDNPPADIDAAVAALLLVHSRFDIKGCACGWAELGESHPAHVAAELRAAGLLAGLPQCGEMREEWGARLTRLDGSGQFEDHWGDGTRALADLRVATHRDRNQRWPYPPAAPADRVWMVTASLIRRFVIVTAPVEVTE